ncbi:LysR family transcriptional regulator [Defluviimonas sp. WL0002]|uniref:LysR family transcriptional regulator n=1 Tax=Albidovulum marisflavi TaxID=2984159 RepID=A0ABT2ZCQ8_9RHOB|nr:LysR family transcriptional regulator [Defluviimonas sp. WL0002]MCV2868909.1 LysR family transcriptional regulator [Defluviimonas sp. WL0002]
MAIKLEMLRAFRVVAEQGSLAEAAGVLGRTPSAVSMTLAQLEANIGAPLFETDRKNRLTKLGELILAEAVRATDVFDSSTGTIRRLTTSIAGTVRIAAVPSVIATLLPGAIARFRESHPEVRLEISDLDSDSVRQRIRFDQADIGILTASVDEPGEGVTIASDCLGIVYREGGRIARALAESEGPASWSLMRLEPLIANPLCAMVAHDDIAGLLDGCNLEARNTTALLSFVREGLGATILPEGAVPIIGGGTGFVSPADPKTLRELRMICSSDRKLGPAALEFWNTLL